VPVGAQDTRAQSRGQATGAELAADSGRLLPVSVMPEERSAFEAWVSREQSTLQRRACEIARRAGLPPLERDDVYNDSMEVIVRKLGQGEAIESLTGYFIRTAEWVAFDKRRSLRRRRSIVGESVSLEAVLGSDDQRLELERVGVTSEVGASVESRAEQSWELTLLREVIEEMDRTAQAVAWLRFVGGLPHSETAAYLDLSEDQVKKHASKVRRRLADGVERVRSGKWCRSRRGLLTRFALGEATEEECAKASAHLSVCSGCRPLVHELRVARTSLPALLPLPVAADAGSLGATLAWLDHVRDSGVELFRTARTALYELAARWPVSGRTGASLSATGIGGGAVKVAAVTLCVGGGTAVCIETLVPVEGLIAKPADSSKEARSRPEPPVGHAPGDVPGRTQALERRREERRAEGRLRERRPGKGVSDGGASEAKPEQRVNSAEEFGFEGRESAPSTASSGDEFKDYQSSSSSIREGSSSSGGGGGDGEFGFEGSESSSGSGGSESGEFEP